jgi:hypothetical protein
MPPVTFSDKPARVHSVLRIRFLRSERHVYSSSVLAITTHHEMKQRQYIHDCTPQQDMRPSISAACAREPAAFATRFSSLMMRVDTRRLRSVQFQRPGPPPRLY